MTKKSDKKIVILGGGITGLVVANELSSVLGDRILVIEKNSFLGGLAATLHRDSLSFDLGSHRIHSDFSPTAMKYLKCNLGIQLLKRPRHGLLYFNGHFLNYPPTISDFLKILSPKETINILYHYLKQIGVPATKVHNYENSVITLIGKEMYTIFYKEFAEKLWGISPRKISSDAIKRRKTFINLKNMWRIISGATKYFYYPREGIGGISSELARKIQCNNCMIMMNSRIKNIELKDSTIKKILIENNNGSLKEIDITTLISTIPIDSLFELTFNKRPENNLLWRNLRILYVSINGELKTKNETFYFPSKNLKIGRISDIQKYSPYLNKSIPGMLLTVEIPLSSEDSEWSMTDLDLLNVCLQDLKKVKIVREPFKVLDYFSLHLEKTYPVYELDWKTKFFSMYDPLNKIKNLFVVGRKGLFLHCNIDHCIIQGMECAKYFLKSTHINKEFWSQKTLKYLDFSARD